LNILVFEDYLPLQTSLIEVLSKFGHHVQGIESAEAFDEEAQDHNVDLVIIDVNLPGEDGFSLARRLHAVQPSLGIIILTAKTDATDKVTGYECGADIYLTKPVGFDELMAAVNALSRRLGKSAPTVGAFVSEPEAIDIHMATASIMGSKGQAELTPHRIQALAGIGQSQQQIP
jgi:DNA-binding response OmpR family regulator